MLFELRARLCLILTEAWTALRRGGTRIAKRRRTRLWSAIWESNGKLSEELEKVVAGTLERKDLHHNFHGLGHKTWLEALPLLLVQEALVEKGGGL